MGLLEWLGVRKGNAPPPEKKSGINIAQWRYAFGPTVSAGVIVNEETALEAPVVLSIVRRISSDIAKLPVKLIRVTATGERVPDTTHPLHRVLAKRPNRWQTPFEFREMMTAHAALHGDAVAIKNLVGGNVDELIPLVPRQFAIRQEKGWRIEYDIFGPNGEVMMRLPSDRVFHLRGPSWNGYKGLNLSHQAREAIGLSAALEGNQAAAMKNGARPMGVLTTDHPLGDDEIDRIADGWRAATTAGNAYSTPLLDNGLKFQAISMNSVDQQLIETRKHQVIEICAAFGILPAVLGIDDKTQAFASVEAMMQAHVDQTVWPWARRWQERLDLDCLDGEGPFEVMLDLSEMRKASTKDQAEADVKLVTNGLRTINEIRARDGFPPVEGGDEIMRPLNMATGADNAGNENEDEANPDSV